MANIPGEIVWQANANAWFTTNAAEVFPQGITIYHTDGRYKFTDGVTDLATLVWRGAGNSTPTLQQVITESPIVDGIIAQSLNGLADISITDTNVQTNINDSTNYAQHTVQATNITTTVNGTGSVITDGNIEFSAPSLTKNSVEIATITDVNNAIIGLLDDRGNYNASSNLFPSTGGSGTAGAILKGDLWTINVSGTLGGVSVTVGDVVRALVDTPGQTSTNWTITENNLGYVPENASNKSTSILTDFLSNVKFPSVKSVYDWATSVFSPKATIIDYSATSTYTGWSSFTIQKIFGIDYPLYTIWTVEVSGVSDSAFATVTLPVSQNATYPNILRGSLVTNNGTNSAVGRVQLLAGTNIIQWSVTASGGGFTAVGTKSVRCQIIQYK